MKPTIALFSVTILLMTAGCSSATQAQPTATKLTPREVLCNPASDAVEIVDELALSTTNAVESFPKLQILKAALSAREKLTGEDLDSDVEWTVLSHFQNTFTPCLSPGGVLLLDRSWKEGFRRDFGG